MRGPASRVASLILGSDELGSDEQANVLIVVFTHPSGGSGYSSKVPGNHSQAMVHFGVARFNVLGYLSVTSSALCSTAISSSFPGYSPAVVQ